MKKQIDIEKLVQWAMRDELPKGQAVAASAWDIVRQYAALGVRVQTSAYQGDGLGFTPGAPHEDALIVADAVRSLPTSLQFDRADVLTLFGEFVAIAGDGVAALMSSLFDPRSLVISKATLGTRPSWAFECPTPYQMFVQQHNARGELRLVPLVHGTDEDGCAVMIKKNRGRKAMRELFDYAMSPRSPLQWHNPSPLHIAECRGEFVAWRRALVSLVADLAGKLVEFEPSAPSVPALPWITGDKPASRVVAVRPLGDPDVRLPLSPKRHAATLPPVESPIEAETVASYARASRTKMKKPAAAQA